VFQPKPWSALQFYSAKGQVNGSLYQGLAFKMASDVDFFPEASMEVGLTVATAASPSGVMMVRTAARVHSQSLHSQPPKLAMPRLFPPDTWC
jgi:hypothetical protein